MDELDFENVVFGYGGNALFNGFSASFAKEQISCIVGPNGCGKSTLAKLAMGLIKPASGRVLIQGRDVASLNPRERARRLGVLVQQQEAPMMTVRELAACGRFPHHGPLSRLDETDAQCIDETLSLAGVYDLRDRPLRSLSGGQRQRARMAMVLAQDTPVVVLDEPTSGLDYRECMTVMETVRTMAERGCAVIMVCHDMEVVSDFAERIVVMADGRILDRGRTHELFSNIDLMRRAYVEPPQVIELSRRLASSVSTAFAQVSEVSDVVRITKEMVHRG